MRLEYEFKNSIKTDQIFAIISREELQNELTKLPRDLALISIYDPDKKPLKTNNYFTGELFISFYDVESNWTDTLKPITNKQGKEIYDFIVKNKNKRFIVNCENGVSCSAGVGLAIETILRDKSMFPSAQKGFIPSKILFHPRYCPNWEVYDKIIMWSN